jgi:hypothetical protein
MLRFIFTQHLILQISAKNGFEMGKSRRKAIG